MKVLYVEDNPLDADVTCRMLRKTAPEVSLEVVTTVREAMARLLKADAATYDVILLDMQLPDGDGMAVLSHVRSSALPVAVVVVTGRDDQDTAVAVLKAGADDYVVKRDDYVARLPVTLAKALSQHRREVSRRQEAIRVLYAGPDDNDAEMARRHLAAYAPHIHLDIARTDREALERLAGPEGATRWDVLLFDCRLSGLNVVEILKELFQARGLDIPAVLITEQGDQEVALQALKLGATDYLPKNPGYLFQLPGTVQDAFHRARLIREQAALRESEERFRATFEQAAVGIAHVSTDGRFLRVNRKLCDILGYTDAELQDLDFKSITHPEDLDADVGNLGRLLRGEIETYSFEKRYLCRDGSAVWVNLTVSLARESSGEPKHFISVVEDISTRKRAEDALNQSEARFRALFENAVYGMYLSNAEDTLFDVNAALVAMLGYDTEASLVGRPVSASYRDPGVGDAFAERCRRESMVRGVEAEWVRRDGQPLYVRLSGRVTRDETGQPSGFEVIVENISEQRSLEAQFRQAQKMEAVGRLAGGIAHDFNNLLTAILGYSELVLSRAPADDPFRADIMEIRLAAERAAGLTRQLLAFSRKQVIAPRVVRLGSVVAEMEPMLRRLIGEDIDLRLRIDGGYVNADPGQLEQVIMNLSVNARDAMPAGGRLAIETSDVDLDASAVAGMADLQPGSYVKMDVADAGSGMDAETLAHLFEPFFTTKERGKGTGLGLSTVHGIVGQASGRVFVTSTPGAGTTFTIYLPRVAGIATPEEARAPQRAGAAGDETILVVEDEGEVRSLMQRVLKRKGYTVLTALDGEAALAIGRERKGTIHLVVSDVVMPRMSGPEMARQLEVLRPDVKVLYLSGYADEKVNLRGAIGAESAFLQKPFTPTALERKVREVLDAPPLGH